MSNFVGNVRKHFLHNRTTNNSTQVLNPRLWRQPNPTLVTGYEPHSPATKLPPQPTLLQWPNFQRTLSP
ncbi:hypothetical protein FH972_010931 [Carpinus fangiana]|uniref:Uncharacterized protein n=1 Tax=Carpinus fangiana TaxID=176857 RepID=A0A660KRS7_9ROSI|nr:hypothetical protein FH972_010931 [Carpinus fangiana]